MHADGWQGNASFVLEILGFFGIDEALEVLQRIFPHFLYFGLVVGVPL